MRTSTLSVEIGKPVLRVPWADWTEAEEHVQLDQSEVSQRPLDVVVEVSEASTPDGRLTARPASREMNKTAVRRRAMSKPPGFGRRGEYLRRVRSLFAGSHFGSGEQVRAQGGLVS